MKTSAGVFLVAGSALGFLAGSGAAWLSEEAAFTVKASPRAPRQDRAPRAASCIHQTSERSADSPAPELAILSAKAAVASRELLAPRTLVNLDLRYRGAPLTIPVWLEFERGRDRLRHRWSPGRRKIQLPAGRYRISARAGSVYLGPWDLDLGEVEGQVDRVLNFTEGLDVYGRLLGAVEGAAPRHILIEPAPDGDAERWRLDQDEGLEGLRFGEEFCFSGLKRGRYRLGVSYDAGVVPLGLVEFDGEPTCVERTLPPPPELRIVPFEIYDPGGRPCAEPCRVSLVSDNHDVRGERRGNTLALRCDPSVVFENLRLVAKSDRFGETEAPVDLQRPSRVALRFSDPARLGVEVADFARRGFEGSLSVLWKPDGGKERTQELLASGHAVFEALKPGGGLLRLKSATVYASRRLELQPGDQTAVLDAPSVARVELELIGEGLESVSLGNKDHWFSFSFGLESRRVLSDVPHGRYLLRYESARREVEVPGPPIVIDRSGRRELRVRITDPDGAYARLGFRDGDRILAINDRPISTRVKTLWGVKPRLLIRRGDEDLELVVDLTAIHDQRRLFGGVLEPSAD